MELNLDRGAALATGRLDQRIGLERRGDPQRVIGAPRQERSPSERWALRPGREREAGRAGDPTGFVDVQPAGCGRCRCEIPDGCESHPRQGDQVLKVDWASIANEYSECGLTELACGVNGEEKRLDHGSTYYRHKIDTTTRIHPAVGAASGSVVRIVAYSRGL
jgi:hypothetical protein